MSETNDDPVARSRALEDAARGLLESGALSDGAAAEIRAAVDQLEADRVDGESPADSADRLSTLLDRHSGR